MGKTNRIRLAPVEESDLPILWQWINSRIDVLHTAAFKPVMERQHRRWFEELQQRRDVVLFGIRLVKGDKLIGSCQLHSIHSVHRTAELQIRIGDAASRGKGYGSQAVEWLLQFAFKDLNLQRVYLHVLEGNQSAVRLYEKIGFVREGVLRRAAHIDGRYVDLVIMGILREEYAAG